MSSFRSKKFHSIFIFLFIIRVYCPITNFRGKKLTYLKDYRFSTHLLTNSSVRTKLQCGIKCTLNEECGSFSYNKKSRLCLTFKVPFLDTFTGEYAPGWNTYVVNEEICPVGLKYSHNRPNGMCYKYSNLTRSDIFGAKATCVSDGGRLLQIDSSDKNEFIGKYLKTSSLVNIYNRPYVSGQLANAQWIYPNSQNMLYFHWFIGEEFPPENIYIRLTPRQEWSWRKVDGTKIMTFLCEIDIG